MGFLKPKYDKKISSTRKDGIFYFFFAKSTSSCSFLLVHLAQRKQSWWSFNTFTRRSNIQFCDRKEWRKYCQIRNNRRFKFKPADGALYNKFDPILDWELAGSQVTDNFVTEKNDISTARYEIIEFKPTDGTLYVRFFRDQTGNLLDAMEVMWQFFWIDR